MEQTSKETLRSDMERAKAELRRAVKGTLHYRDTKKHYDKLCLKWNNLIRKGAF